MLKNTNRAPCFSGGKRTLARSIAAVSLTAIATSLGTFSPASADPAVYFNDDVDEGIQTFEDTIAAADAAYNADNPGANRTSHIYAFDILNTTGSSFLVIGSNGAPSVTVKTFRGGSAAPNNGNGDAGSDGFTNWSNSHNGTFAGAESMGYTYEFYESDGTTPFEMNALGTLVNDWGTCCTNGNPTPDGSASTGSEVYLRFGASDPLLLGGISSSIGGTEHFIGAINDTNFFNSASVTATGNGEYFGVGGYLTFSSVALNSVPSGSSVVDGDGLENPVVTPPSVPDIDTGSTYYTAAQLGASQVNPNFVGGTLQFSMDTFALTDFTVQSQGGTIDTEGNVIELLGQFSGAGTISKTGAGMLYLAGNNTNQGGFTILEGTLVAYNDQNLGGGPLTIGNGTFQQDTSRFSSYHDMIVQDANSTVNVQNGQMNWYGNVSGNGALNLAGTGSLWLIGTNTYTGGTFVEAGTLAGSAGAIQGDIANNGTVEFTQSTDGTYAGDMNGAGRLVKTGNGSLVLTGNNAYTGGTQVDAGTLAGAAGAIQGDIANNATVAFTQSASGTYSGDMSGAGRLVKIGNGSLILTGDNTYSGGTLVKSGALVGSAGAIQGNIENNGIVQFVQSTDGTYASDMNGTGLFVKSGEGLLEVTGANSNEAGFEILEGTLRASRNESLGGGSLTIGNATFQAGADMTSDHAMILGSTGSTVDVQDHELIWQGAISGDGMLNVAGPGRLVLAGSNSYTGGTNVMEGTLAGSTDTLLGDILNDGMVEFNQTSDGSYSGTMIGSGGLRKFGEGVLRMAGAVRLSGNSVVETGALDVNGLFGTNLLTVRNGASLLGTGGVDGDVSVLSGGILSPGNSPGTLYVSGDVTLNDGSLFYTEIDGRIYSADGGAGSYDRLVLTGEGSTFTANGTINPILRGITGDANNDFDAEIGDVFTVVVADNIAGAFDEIAQPAEGIPSNTRFNLIYNANTIQLAIVAESLGDLARSGGQRGNGIAVGTALDVATANGRNASGVLETLFAEFNGMSASEVNTVLASLSGDIHAHVLESTESIVSGSDSMILAAARGNTGIGGVDTELKNGIHLWSRADARGASYDPDARGMGFDEDVYGLTVGATFINRHDLRMGVAGSYKTAEVHNDSANGATSQMLSAYLYGSRAVTTKLTLSGLVGYTEAKVKTTRTTAFPNTIGYTKSDKPVSMTHAQLEARYKAATIGETSVYAIGGLRAAALNVHKYAEDGNDLDTRLTLEGEGRDTLQSKLGAEIARQVAGTDLAVFADWTRDLGDDPTVERTVWLGDAVWQTKSTHRGLDTYNYGFSARRKVNDRVGLELEYTGRYNSPNYDAQQLMFGVNLVW